MSEERLLDQGGNTYTCTMHSKESTTKDNIELGLCGWELKQWCQICCGKGMHIFFHILYFSDNVHKRNTQSSHYYNRSGLK